MIKRKSKSKLRACHVYYTKFNNNAVLIREAKAMKEKGFAVDIICLRANSQDKIYQTYEGLNLYCIQSREVSEKSSILYFYHLALFFIKTTFILSIRSIYKKYDIVHITSPPDIMVFSAIIPKILGAKLILDIHDINPELYMRKLNVIESHFMIRFLRYLENISCRFADHVITVTDLWRDKLIERHVPRSKCSVLLNVPDEAIFKPFTHKNQPADRFNLFYHGSLEEHFGVDTLLKAVPIIRQHIPNMLLHIYGGGRLLEEFKTLTHKTEIDDCVHFHDSIPFYELPKVLMDADVGIVPTKDHVFSDEALSMKSLEYITLGIPIVISRNKAHNYYYDNSMVKFFEPENEEDLARGVIDIFKHSAERISLIEKSKEFLKKHNWKSYRKIYFQVIEQLLSSKETLK
jgi:glycosyltransferase involved in cell wall biosynthesis